MKTIPVKMDNGVKYNLRFIWMVTFAAAIGGFLFGYDFVVIGGAKPFYEPFLN